MADLRRRRTEFDAIAMWIDANDDPEHDFIVLGDFNSERDEFLGLPSGTTTLNNRFVATTPLPPGPGVPEAFDHVLYHSIHTSEIDLTFGFFVVDLVERLRESWQSSHSEPYPGDPYDHNEFRSAYSDHHPVVFRLAVGEDDD